MRALQSQEAIDKMQKHLNRIFEDAQKKLQLPKLMDGIGKFDIF
jgi:hypothetical protein